MSKLKTKYNFLIFIFLMLTLVFCIDGVKAYTIYEDDEIKIDEEYIYNKLLEYDSQVDIKNVPYVYCEVNYPDASVIRCVFFSKDVFDYTSVSGLNSNYPVYRLTIDSSKFTDETYFYNFYYNRVADVLGRASTTTFDFPYKDSITFRTYTNFDIEVIYDSISLFDYNLLNFEGTNLQFNENLFKDNPNFKQVCVDSNKKFAITATSLDSPDDSRVNYDVDYMWFPYQLVGLNSAFYDSSNEFNSSYYIELEDSHFHYYFNSIERINDVYNNDLYFSKKGYTNSNSYYLWSAYPFEILDQENHTKFKFYWFENPITITQGSSGTVHGGGGLTLGSDKEVQLNKQYCFYIKNQYNVEYLNIDEYGDISGQVTLPSGIKNIVTSYYKNNKPSGGLLSQVSVFINEISEPLDFIKDNVYQFYLSMPLILRMFLTSVFSILIVKFIIGMVVK